MTLPRLAQDQIGRLQDIFAGGPRLVVVVPGKPVPKGRPRLGSGHAYTPAETRAYESTVAFYALQARQRVASWPLDARYRVDLVVRRKGRYDLDNIAKAALDSCNRLLWKDDAQVDDLRIRRERPGDRAEALTMTVEVLP
ncbi:MAG TPA: RusA family crossover junction endodeoxyribonuclease [Anaeromyxobacteraceae bacterium]|nr:RusA family crossover junction endodeoxyribonuclease [Anaeromyxobacteraceae bacterium]